MSYSSEVLADSPLWYARQDDLSGTTMTDSSGNGHNGTYTGTYSLNAASLLVGDANPAVDYTSAKGTVTGASWMNSSSFSVEVIVKPDTVPGGSGYAFIVSRDLNGTVGPWWMSLKGGKVSFYLFAGSGTEFIGSATLTAGNTYHIVCTYDGANMKIYINGSLDASQAKTGTPTANTQDLVVGNWNASSLPFDGEIDETALYGSALSGARISAHYTAATVSPDATVAVPVATATATALAPTVVADASVGVPVATATADALVPTVSAVTNATVLVPVATATAAALTPTLALGVDTDTSNVFNGRERGGTATIELVVPVATTPAGTSRGTRVDKAVPLPLPTLVNGRPT